MTELQCVELDILKQFIGICDQLKLKYFLVCGSALGAAKYGGFIPWDDDVDVALLREEYNIFLEKAPQMLPEYMFLQNHKSDARFPHYFSKLRNSNTTYIEKSVAHLPIHHGVYIDIFPLDGYPKEKEEIYSLEKNKLKFARQLLCVYRNIPMSKKARLFCALERMLGYHKRSQAIVEKMEKLLSRYSAENSEFWCNHGNWQGKLEYAPREQYGNGVMMKFEGLSVRIPERYDEYLTQKYGDWRAELPKEQQVGHHYYEVMDLKKSYVEYIKI